jgi:hypothetical protein
VLTRPPMPLETDTPSRSGSTCGAPACCHASRAATSASCSHRSTFRVWTRSSMDAGSTAADAAIRVGRSAAQEAVSDATPDLPASIADHVDSTSPPTGVVAPSPVTTTPTWPELTVPPSFIPPSSSARIGAGLPAHATMTRFTGRRTYPSPCPQLPVSSVPFN